VDNSQFVADDVDPEARDLDDGSNAMTTVGGPPLNFTHQQLPARIVFGAGRRRETPAELDALDATRVLVIGGAHDTSAIDELVTQLALPADTIVGVRPHVPADTVRQALAIVDDFGPDAVVAVGGGSATGLGKMIALERDVVLLAIPTTYAGSEMTPIWGTTDHGVKRTGRSMRVLPSTVIYDPELTLSLPRSVTVNSTFNALAHCVEALWLPDTSPITADASVGAIRSMVSAVRDVVDRLDDVGARARLLYGAHRAGSVLAAAGTGALHKTAHVLGGMFDLDHGAMYAVLTPPMVGYHLTATPDARSRLVEALGPDPQQALTELAAQLGAPGSLSEIGFPADQLSAAAGNVAEHTDVPLADVEPLLAGALATRSESEPS
jgi:maleylacetate reductase